MHARLPPVSSKRLGDASPLKWGNRRAGSNHTRGRVVVTEPDWVFTEGVTVNRSAGVYRMNGRFHE